MPLPVGAQFADLELGNYTNINKLFEQRDRLHGVETLCGDWTGTTLVVGQDFAHTSLILKRLSESPEENPFHHDPDSRTNQNLCKFLRPGHTVSIDGSNSKHCGVLYANAVWLLKSGQTLNARLPTPGRALDISRPVLLRTIEAMPKLKIILCLGRIPFRGVLRALDEQQARDRDWRQCLNSRSTVRINHIKICALSHPGSLGIMNRSSSGTNEDKCKLVAEDFRIALER